MMTARKTQPTKRSPGRPPGRTSEATRTRILAAARVCFARTGYAATTNKDIGEHAEVSPAAIYLYFDSKTALYLSTYNDAKEELVQHYRASVAETATLREGFRALLVASAELHERDPSLAAFLSALPVEMQRNEELARAVAEAPSEVVQIIEGIVDRGVESGELARVLAPQVVSMFVACTLGFSMFAASMDRSSLWEIIDAFNALVDGTLFRETKKRKRK